MLDLGPAAEPLTAKQIIATYQGALDETVRAATDPTYEFDRQLQLNKARLQWHMVKGNHFVVPGMVETAYGQVADYLGWANVGASEETNGAEAKLACAINLIGGDCKKFVAVMGNSAPRVKAIADDPADQQNLDAARLADACVRDLRLKWKSDRKQRILALHQYTTGPVYGRTVWVTDPRKYGRTVEPKIEVQEQEQPDGTTTPVPSQAGVQQYDNGDVELHLYTVLEVEHPYMANDLDECPYLKCEVLRSKWDLLAAFPDALASYRDQEIPDEDATASSSVAAEARESVATPSGLGKSRRKDMWRFREWWLQPFLYEAIGDATARKVLQTQYSDGLYIAKAGSVTVQIDNRKLTDEWAVCKTGLGQRMLEDPIATDSVPIQRAIDDLANMAQETVLRAIPQTWVNSSLVDRQAMKSKEAVPGEYILTAIPVDTDLARQFYQPAPARMSDQLMPLQTGLRAYQQDITGIRPELSGSGPPTQTYREAKQRKDQALMQLSPQAHELGYFWEGVYENGVRMRAKFGSGTVKASRQGAYGAETDAFEMAQLQTDGWHCEADDNFPMSEADRFDKMWGLLKEFPPEVVQVLGLMDPINLEQTLELIQVPGFESVVGDHKRKTLADVAQLLSGQPVNGQPSIPVDPEDNHQFAAQFLQVWMISPTGQRQKNGRPAGFENVRLFWQAQQAMVPQPPAAPPPVRASLSVSAKAEDMGPAFTNELLQGAGLPPLQPQPPQAVPAAMIPKQQPPAPAAPAPGGGQPQAAPEEAGDQEDKLPPINEGPAGPQPTVQ